MLRAATCCVSLTFLAACATGPTSPAADTPRVPAFAETASVGNQGDAADDPAIWVNPQTGQAIVIGTDKRDGGGLYVYDLDGSVLQYLSYGPMNNVDVRPHPFREGRGVAVASHRRASLVEIFDIDPNGTLNHAQSFPVSLPDPYGICLGKSAGDAFWVGVTSTDDGYEQALIVPGKDGLWETAIVRTLSFGGQAEGCVFDDRTGDLFIGVEEQGIFRYRADPALGDSRETVALVDNETLVADVEGLSIFAEGEDGGYLLASSQSIDTVVFYSLPQAVYAGAITVGPSEDGRVDRVTHTDGLDVTSAPIGPSASGLLVMQDDENTDPVGVIDTQNFKIIDWAVVDAALKR